MLIKVFSQSHLTTSLTNENVFQMRNTYGNPSNENYLVETVGLNLLYVIYGSTNTAMANLIFRANTPTADLIIHHCKHEGVHQQSMENQVCILLHARTGRSVAL